MRVLWFTNTPANAIEYFDKEIKGTGGWLKALDEELQNHVDLHIAFHNSYYNYTTFKYKNTTYHPIKIYKNKFHKYWSIFTNKVIDEEFKSEYLKIINEVQPDIIHIHGTENPFGCIIDDINIPVAISIQGVLTVISHKYCSGIEKQYLSVSKRKNIFFRSNFKKSYLKMKKMAEIERRTLINCKYIFGRTDWDERITKILAPNRIYFHSDEMLRENFYYNKWELPQNNFFKIFTTNSNNFYKGFETICECLYLLNKLNQNIIWYVAGINENDLIVKVVKKKLGSKYPKDNLVLLGNLNENELIDQLLNSCIYVMPSHIENSPNNLCEAMFLGMPCISTFAGGAGSFITDKFDGILIQDGDPYAMAGTILELVNDNNRAIILGKHARETALKRHDKNKIINNLINNYNEIINDIKQN